METGCVGKTEGGLPSRAMGERVSRVCGSGLVGLLQACGGIFLKFRLSVLHQVFKCLLEG
jgi:hypothetical protein